MYKKVTTSEVTKFTYTLTAMKQFDEVFLYMVAKDPTGVEQYTQNIMLTKREFRDIAKELGIKIPIQE